MRLQPLAIALGLLAVCSTSAKKQTLLTEFSTAKARMNEGDASCIMVAAELTPCLSAVSPGSRLTTMEEADCCTTLLVFKEANCYCLAPESIQELSGRDRCALRSRLAELGDANQRCGWEAVSCPTPDMADALDSKNWSDAATENETLEADLERFYGRSWEERRQGQGSFDSLSQPARLVERQSGGLARVETGQERSSRLQKEVKERDDLLDQMTTYLNKVIKLTEALSIERGDEVDLTIEVTMGSTNFAVTAADTIAVQEVSPGGSYSFWAFVVAFCLSMMAIALLLSTSKECGSRRGPDQYQTSDTSIVVAADEVHSLGKL